MPDMSDTNQSILNRLVDEYNALPSYKKWFYPRTLSAALDHYKTELSSEAAAAVCYAFLYDTWLFQKGMFSPLYNFSDTWFVCALEILNEAGLFMGDAAQSVFDGVAGHENLEDFVWALDILTDVNLLHGEAGLGVFNVLIGRKDLKEFAYALVILNTAGLLNSKDGQGVFNALAVRRDLKVFVCTVASLLTTDLLIGEAAIGVFNALVKSPDLTTMTCAIVSLTMAGLLSGEAAQTNFNALAEHQNPCGMANAIEELINADLLSGQAGQDNFMVVASQEHSQSVANAFEIFNTAGLLTDDTAQSVFDLVMKTHSSILFHEDTVSIWNRMTNYLVTQTGLHAIIAICDDHRDNEEEARRLFIDYAHQNIIGLNGRHTGAARAFNSTQSTHTLSIHETASASAIRLMRRYGSEIKGSKLDGVISTLDSWLAKKSIDSLKVEAAKRCLLGLKARGDTFIDDSSGVSTKQLIALVWLAFHDDSKRQGCLEDAKSALIEGLYEGQRGYNLSETGVDDGIEDSPICDAGIFNKILEKGCGLHKDIELIFITKEWASRKLPIVVNEIAMDYLKNLAKSPEKRPLLLELIGEIKKETNENTVRPIWDSIYSKVSDWMFGEFGSLFGDSASSPGFLSFISFGVDVMLSELNVAELDQLAPSTLPNECASAALMNPLISGSATPTPYGVGSFLENEGIAEAAAPTRDGFFSHSAMSVDAAGEAPLAASGISVVHCSGIYP